MLEICFPLNLTEKPDKDRGRDVDLYCIDADMENNETQVKTIRLGGR